jgi:hypothetical protein
MANDLLETQLDHLLPSAAVINPVSIVSHGVTSLHTSSQSELTYSHTLVSYTQDSLSNILHVALPCAT